MSKISRYTRIYFTFCLLGRKPAHFAKTLEKTGLKGAKRGVFGGSTKWSQKGHGFIGKWRIADPMISACRMVLRVLSHGFCLGREYCGRPS
jgi:hypothetical protein